MDANSNPLTSPVPKEVPLKLAPLVRVIGQIRFPEILSVEQREFVAPFQEAIRRAYPILREEHIQGLVVGPAGAAPAKPQIAWRFSDAKNQWRVSLTPGFLALETTHYASRSDFLNRFQILLTALGEHIEPVQIDRVGLRYIDRIVGDAVDDLSLLVRPEVRGIAGTEAGKSAIVSLCETIFEENEARLLARWGVLPPETTVDPAVVEPSKEKSWILDLDMFGTTPMEYAPDRIIKEVRRYAERIYTVFRWAVTDDFLARYGGSQ